VQVTSLFFRYVAPPGVSIQRNGLIFKETLDPWR